MRIVIAGAGAIGGYIGARLAQAGADVVLFARGPHLRAMQERGLRVVGADGDFTVRPQVSDSLATIGTADVVFLGDHGGYRKSLAKPDERLNREWSKSGGRAHALPEIRLGRHVRGDDGVLRFPQGVVTRQWLGLGLSPLHFGNEHEPPAILAFVYHLNIQEPPKQSLNADAEPSL